MPLTKVRYDMLDLEVTEKITQSISLSGAGSPLVFAPNQEGTTETLTKFKVDSQEKTIRSTSFVNDKLVIELASFSPTGVGASGQSLAWDQAASSFSISATNPSDFPDEYLANVKSPLTAGTGTVELDVTKYTKSGTSLPLSATGNIATTFTLQNGYYIRPAGASGATGGSASAAVTFLKQDASEYSPTYTWTTNWQNISHDISLAALSGKSFLQKYTSSNYTVSQSGLSNAAHVVHTVSSSNGTPSNLSGSGTLPFATAIHKDNKNTTTTTVTVASVFTRPAAVTGSQYTHSPNNKTSDNVASSASFSYPSIQFTTAVDASPTLGAIIDDSNTGNLGFKSTVTLLGSETKNYPLTAITNSGAEPVKFWFGVRTSASQPTLFKTGDAVAQYAVAPVGLTTVDLGLQPNTSIGTSAEDYTFYGFNIAGNATVYVVIS
jgi:hypothetical protein